MKPDRRKQQEKPDSTAKRQGNIKPHHPYDLSRPDSLITLPQYKARQIRFGKFQKRAANPNAKPNRHNMERLAIIDWLLSDKTNGSVVEAMLASIQTTQIYPFISHRLTRALLILKGEENDLDSSGGSLVIPISREARGALMRDAGGAVGQFAKAAEIIEAYYGLKPANESEASNA
jgi:hypothetical protein